MLRNYNPRILKAHYFKQKDVYGKRYFPCFYGVLGNMVFCSRKHYRTATEAINRAKEIHRFWIKLYERNKDGVSKNRREQVDIVNELEQM